MTIPAIRIAGQAQQLGKKLGRGGEGEVYALESQPGKAIKIYKEELRESRESKVRAMVEGGLAGTTNLVAFPAEIATDSKGRFAGFVMRLVSGYRPIHDLYGPKSRRNEFPKADFRFLVRASQNVARAVATIHEAGCVIGDFNHSGMLVAKDATVALIDADSFQFTLNGRIFPCVVGVPEFTPPELQRRDLKSIARTREHDCFGLAVAIFHLLAMGKHPYAGRYAGKDLGLGEAIEQHRFAFSIARQSQTLTTPPPGSVLLGDFPKYVAQAFEASFGMSPSARPTPATWVRVLEELESSLNRCTKISTHFYPAAATGCVWCRITNQSGVEMFPTALSASAAIPSSGSFDFERIVAAIRGTSLPLLEEILPKPAGSLVGPSPIVAKAKRERVRQRIPGAIALAAATAGFAWEPQAVIVWIGLTIFGLYRFFRPGNGLRGLEASVRQACVEAEVRARQYQEAFLKRSGIGEFYSIREEAERDLAKYVALPAREARELAQLKSTREQRQRSAFLDRFLIRRASIPGIGPAKTASLASFGIETADDISNTSVMAVPGFGPATTAKLVAWRRAHEAKFRYNPQSDPSDLQAETAVRSAIATARMELQTKLTAAATILRTAPTKLKSLNPDQPLLNALERLARAESDCLHLGIVVPPRTPIALSQSPSPTVQQASATASRAPKCPRCGSAMRIRTARRGTRRGNQFWGCTQYPRCTGTRA